MKYVITLSKSEVERVLIKHVEDITGKNALDISMSIGIVPSNEKTGWVTALKSVDVEVDANDEVDWKWEEWRSIC